MSNYKKIIVVLFCIFTIFCICVVFRNFFNYFKREEVFGNLSNNGLAIEYNGEIYYSKYENGIVKYSGNDEVQISTDNAYSMNMYENKIFYLCLSELNTIDIKFINLDTLECQKFKSILTTLNKFYIEENCIYYYSSENNCIACINLKTKEENVAFNTSVQDFCVYKSKIYFIDGSNMISKMDVNGKNVSIIECTGDIHKFQIADNYIYFYEKSSDGICKVKLNGKGKKLVSSFIQNEMYNVTSKNIYYFNEENKQICVLNLQNGYSKILANVNVNKTKINIVKDEVYFLDESENNSLIYQMNRVKNNGKEIKKIEY